MTEPPPGTGPAPTGAPAPPPSPWADEQQHPSRRRGPLIAAAAVLLAAATAAGVWLAGGGGQDPAPSPSAPAASPEPTPSPTASPSPATPEEQAAADLDALVRGFRAVEDQAYSDPAIDPGATFDLYLRNPASNEEVVRVLTFRRNGNTQTGGGTEVHSVQVTALDLPAGTATVVECKTLSVTGTDGTGQAQAGTTARQEVEWTAKSIPGAGWRLYTSTVSAENSC